MRKVNRFSSGIVLCLVLVFVGALPLLAQSDAARLQGVVTDPTNALVPDAKVRVTDVATNRLLETTTAPGTGAWSFPVLPPSKYVLEITKEGFKAVKQNMICRCNAYYNTICTRH